MMQDFQTRRERFRDYCLAQAARWDRVAVRRADEPYHGKHQRQMVTNAQQWAAEARTSAERIMTDDEHAKAVLRP